MVFHWSLSDSKSPQVSRTLLSILAVLNNAVVWMVSTRLLTSKSSTRFSNPLVTVPNAPITIGIIVTCMFLCFFQFPSKVEVLILLFTFFQFYSVISWDCKVDNNTTVSWWFSTRRRETASLLNSPGLFLVFWSISIIQYFGWSSLVLLYPSPPVLVPILR